LRVHSNRKGWRFSMYLSIRDEFHFFYESLHILQQLAKEPGFIKLKIKNGAQDWAALCNLG
ncbi:hypothetical protein, partial [Bacillus toyonensis]